MNMSFSSALVAMQRGHRVHRKVWPSHTSIAIEQPEDDIGKPHFGLYRESCAVEVWVPNADDILSHDWLIH